MQAVTTRAYRAVEFIKANIKLEGVTKASVSDAFKGTSSVAMNPIIKFTTLVGLLAVELAVTLTAERGALLTLFLAALFFAVSVVFVWRSFYAMRIRVPAPAAGTGRVGAVARGK